MTRKIAGALAALVVLSGPLAVGQYPAGQFFTPNVRLVSHVPLGAANTVMDIETEQELSRPFVYITRSNYGRVTPNPSGFDVINVKDPGTAQVIQRWRID